MIRKFLAVMGTAVQGLEHALIHDPVPILVEVRTTDAVDAIVLQVAKLSRAVHFRGEQTGIHRAAATQR